MRKDASASSPSPPRSSSAKGRSPASRPCGRMEGRQDGEMPGTERCRPTWCCWPWASSRRHGAGSLRCRQRRPRQCLESRTEFTGRLRHQRCPRCLRPATCAAARAWWCGRSAKAPGRARAVDEFLMGFERPAALMSAIGPCQPACVNPLSFKIRASQRPAAPHALAPFRTPTPFRTAQPDLRVRGARHPR